MRHNQDKAYWRKGAYSVLALIILFGESAQAIPSMSPIPEHLDTGTWLRIITATLLAVLIWIWKGTDATIKTHGKALEILRPYPTIVDGHTNRIEQFQMAQLELKNRIAQTEKEVELLKHTAKNLESAVSLQREMMLTKYHDKEETDSHRIRVEETLDKQAAMLHKICARLDNMSDKRHG